VNGVLAGLIPVAIGFAVSPISSEGVLLRNNHKIVFWITGLLGLVFLARSIPILL
jgi:hypothetical protein